MAIPRKKLVGQNPTVVDRIYSDDYLKALNEMVTVDEVFGNQRTAIAKGQPVVGRLVIGTLGRTEWENHLVSLVMTAAETGKWSAVVSEPDKHLPGLEEVQKRHFGYVTDYQGVKYLLPSAMYVAYCQENLSS